jgi:hypothetical protein
MPATRLLAALVLLVCSPLAAAHAIYAWTGHCTIGCDGTAAAILRIHGPYEPGSDLIVSVGAETPVLIGGFLYQDSERTVELPGSRGTGTPGFMDWFTQVGDFLPEIEGPGHLTLIGGAFVFWSFSDGSWRTGHDGANAFIASGTAANFTRLHVPEPTSLGLLALGIFLLGWFTTRRTRH